MIQCKWCGKEFLRKNKNQIFCSELCSSRYRNKYIRCHKECNKKYVQSENDVNQKILLTHTKLEYIFGYTGCESKIIIMCKDCGSFMIVSAQLIRKNKPTKCINCNKIVRAYNNKKAKELKIEKEKRKKIQQFWKQPFTQIKYKICKECGELFIGNKKYCSDKCDRHHANHTKEINRRIKIQKQIIDKDISLKKLYQRDHGRCYICGCICNWNDYENKDNVFYTGKSYPTIEHVIPLSKDGKHSWDNVKLACFDCNTKKSTKVYIPH